MGEEEKHPGAADIKLAGLSIWIHGHQYPDATDYSDGNWLRVTARCSATGSEVEVSGAFLHLPEIIEWMKASERLHETLTGSANLECIEPELGVKLEAKPGGQIQMPVNITPNNLTQQHSVKFEIDQSYLSSLTSECRKIIQKFPVKDDLGNSARPQQNVP
jgi:hypothetical protein